jgi:large subunit ribosomal protein L10
MTSHIRAWKEAKKEEITNLAKKYPVIAIVTLNELPANIMSLVRKRLGENAVIVVAKTRVIQKALKETDFDTSKLDSMVKESVGIIFSEKNPFELFSFIKKNKGAALAKPGDIASVDIIIQAGDSGLPPGPALSTLKAAGLKVKVAGPTIEITNDKVVTKKGEEVTKEVAEVLGKLNMKPMRIGMKVLGVFDKTENVFYKADILDVDGEELFNKFTLAYQQALNLSVNAEIYNDASTEMIVIKAQREAIAINDAVLEVTSNGDSVKDEPKTQEVVEEPKVDEVVNEVSEESKSEEEVVEEPKVDEVVNEVTSPVEEDEDKLNELKEKALMDEVNVVEKSVETNQKEEDLSNSESTDDVDAKAEALEQEVLEKKGEN